MKRSTRIQNISPDTQWEQHIEVIASEFAYPPTPDMKAQVSHLNRSDQKRIIRLRLAQGFAALVLLLILTSILVPSVRAGLLEMLQIGGIRILLKPPEPTPTATVLPAHTPESPQLPVTATPGGTPTLTPAAFTELAGETTLEGARLRSPFRIPLPNYPDNLGLPDHVYQQDFGGLIVVLIWLQPGSDDKVRLSLHILGPGVTATKGPVEEIEVTSVHGQHAVWTTGPYMLVYQSGRRIEPEPRILVEGHVLIWESDGITYRLETDLTLEEAVRIAESIH